MTHVGSPRAGAAKPGAEQSRTPLPRAQLLLRPFGYLSIALVWLAIGLLLLAISSFLLIAAVAGDLPWYRDEGLADAIIGGIVITVFLVPIAGWLVTILPMAALAPAGLSFVYFFRSLRPSYRFEELSGSVLVDPMLGESPRQQSLSLLPVRKSRVTDVLLSIYLRGWGGPGLAGYLATLPIGVAYVLVTGVAMVNSDDPLTIWELVAYVVGGVLALTGIILLIRAFKREPLGEPRQNSQKQGKSGKKSKKRDKGKKRKTSAKR